MEKGERCSLAAVQAFLEAQERRESIDRDRDRDRGRERYRYEWMEDPRGKNLHACRVVE